MWEIAGFLNDLGNSSLSSYWLPVALWSGLALLVYLLLRVRKQSNIAFQYHGRAALLLALPIGLAASYLTSWMQVAMQGAQSQLSAKFIVIQSPIALPDVEPVAATPLSGAMWWTDPMIWVGLLMAVILTVSLQQVILLLLNLNGLRKFARSLDSRPLSLEFKPQIDELRGVRRVRIAFSNRIEVPFTFGSFRPVIVLPEFLRHDKEKRIMSIRHELAHIKHSDYALNMLLLLAEALFWFHPMVYLLHREVHEYREISCDREVLTYSSISRRKYAELLLELAPRKVFHRRPSINMSVQPNTLKKRIRIIQSYNRSNAPLRSSVLLTLVTAIFVTGIMACTDLQRPRAEGPQFPGEQITLESASVTVNGTSLLSAGDSTGGLTMSGPSGGLAVLTLGQYGTFTLSGREFGEAEPAATINGRTLAFSRNGVEVFIRSQAPITGGERADLWVQHDVDIKGGESNGNPVIRTHFFNSWQGYMDYRQASRASMPSRINGGETQQGDGGRDFFVAVEHEPELIGSLQDLQAQIAYPEQARRAGIEGQVFVQFIVNTQGRVEDPRAIRSVHPLLDQVAIEGVRQHARFRPGMQRNQPVRVQVSLPIVFRISNDPQLREPPPPPVREENAPGSQAIDIVERDSMADFESPGNPFREGGYELQIGSNPGASGEMNLFAYLENNMNRNEMSVEELQTSDGTVSGRLVEVRTGDPIFTASAEIVELEEGDATDSDGIFSISNLEPGNYTLRITFVGFETLEETVRIDE